MRKGEGVVQRERGGDGVREESWMERKDSEKGRSQEGRSRGRGKGEGERV